MAVQLHVQISTLNIVSNWVTVIGHLHCMPSRCINNMHLKGSFLLSLYCFVKLA